MDDLNLVKNPRFAVGKRAPRWWNWCADGQATRWAHEASMNGSDGRVMLIRSTCAEHSAVWSQTVRCKHDRHYRIEADVECHCDGAGEEAGLVLSVHPCADDAPPGEALHFAPVHRAARELTLLLYF